MQTSSTSRQSDRATLPYWRGSQSSAGKQGLLTKIRLDTAKVLSRHLAEVARSDPKLPAAFSEQREALALQLRRRKLRTPPKLLP